MNLIVDIGNSLAKVAVMDKGRIEASFSAPQLGDLPLPDIVESYGIVRSIVSSTRADGAAAQALLSDIVGHCMLFDSSVEVPLRIGYLTPQTLGRDRVAAAVGAASSFEGRNIMIVDFGTAITIDFVSDDGLFEGGFISPGVTTRFRALNEFTASLPLCGPTPISDEIAQSTTDAISGGVMNGIRYEIEGYIEHYSRKKCNLFVIFSGGDSNFFDKQIKNAIFADRDLVFKGLDRILDYNA